ncbi:MAG: hypothetical protein R3D81_04420 [Thalassovita sp.]
MRISNSDQCNCKDQTRQKVLKRHFRAKGVQRWQERGRVAQPQIQFDQIAIE